jgi:hypothetical protein
MNHAAALSPAVSRPAHVSEATVYDFALQRAFSPKAMLALEEDIGHPHPRQPAAGLDAVMNGMGFGIRHLARDRWDA